MSQDWLVVMGIDVRRPHGMGDRSLLGHRLLLILQQGPKSMRGLHAATGRVVAGNELRGALAELQETGLIASSVVPSGRRGGRPREVWCLLYPGSSAIRVAEGEIAGASAGRARARREKYWKPPTLDDLRRAGLMPPEGGRKRRRRLKPVPEDVADEVCDWIASGRYLRDFCRRPGTPATRTIYAWGAKDQAFRRRFQKARDFGEWMIRETYAEYLDSPMAMAAIAGGIRSRREFNRRFIRPIDLRLQRWRRHPRRRSGAATGR